MASYICISSDNKVWNSLAENKKVIGAIRKDDKVTVDTRSGEFIHISQSPNNVTGWSKASWFKADTTTPPTPPPSNKKVFTLVVQGFKPYTGELEPL